MLLCLRVFLSLRNISYGKLKKLRGKRYHDSPTVRYFQDAHHRILFEVLVTVLLQVILCFSIPCAFSQTMKINTRAAAKTPHLVTSEIGPR